MRFAALAAIVLMGATAFAQPTSRASKAPKAGSPVSAVLVVVNDKPITQGDLDLLMLTRGIAENERAKIRRRLLEQLVERRLMHAYLAGRKVQADSRELDAQVARIKRLIQKRGDDPKKVLGSLGYDDRTLRDELSLPLAWQAYLARVLTADAVREYFDMHRAEFDGTEIRASQIYLKLSEPVDDAGKAAALTKLADIRAEIVAEKITFADAAKKYSESPSRDTGGDVGFFGFQGKMPLAFTRVVFPLKVGDVSEPFVTPFGAHLVTVTERKPGSLSLEDARPKVLTQLSNKLWNETIEQERSKARVEWKE